MDLRIVRSTKHYSLAIIPPHIFIFLLTNNTYRTRQQPYRKATSSQSDHKSVYYPQCGYYCS